MTKRVSLKDRKAQEPAKGVDVFFQQTNPEPNKDEAAVVSPKLAKVTLYMRPDQVTSIEEIQLQERKRTGKKPDKSDLTIEAFDLLIQKYSKTATQ